MHPPVPASPLYVPLCLASWICSRPPPILQGISGHSISGSVPGELSERSGAVSGLTHIDPQLVGCQLCKSMVWEELAGALLCHIWEVVVGGGEPFQLEESKVCMVKKTLSCGARTWTPEGT